MVSDGLAAELTEVKQRNPQHYGYLNLYWQDAKQGLDNTKKNYACVKDIFDNIADPKTTTQGLGQTLSLLTELDVLSVHSNRSNAIIYDLTTYRPDRLTEVGKFLNDE